jgi:uncharacterized protein
MRFVGSSIGTAAALAALIFAGRAQAMRTEDLALRRAAQAGDVPEIQHQLQLGADPDQANALLAAVDANQLNAVKYLLAHGAHPNAWATSPTGASSIPVFVAARQGNREMLGYLKVHGADLNAEWSLDGHYSSTPLGLAILCGNLIGAQLLIEYGADVNFQPKHGDPPLRQSLSASQNGMELTELLLRHGADPDVKNAAGVSVRDESRRGSMLWSLINQVKPLPGDGKLEPEDPVLVGQTLHFKAICDVGLPTYRQYMAADYSRWRASQAKAIAQLENSPDFQKQQTEAKQNFLENRANLSGEEAIEQTAALRQMCDQALASVFRTGVPMYGSVVIKAASAVATYAPAAATAKPTVIIRRMAPPPVSGGAAPTPPPAVVSPSK